jgi:diacylglycerol kinase family enzyme
VYYYVYDSFLSERSYQKILPKIETAVHNLGLTGERAQSSTLKSVDQLVKDAALKGHSPLVVVGHDGTFNAAINALLSSGQNIPLAYIPVDDTQPLARLLGINLPNAVVSLSRRVVRRVALLQANGHYFMSRAICAAQEPSQPKNAQAFLERLRSQTLEPFGVTIDIDGKQKINAQIQMLTILNRPIQNTMQLELTRYEQRRFRQPQIVEQSVLTGKSIYIETDAPRPVSLDGRTVLRTPLRCKVSDRTIEVVVGAQRQFV